LKECDYSFDHGYDRGPEAAREQFPAESIAATASPARHGSKQTIYTPTANSWATSNSYAMHLVKRYYSADITLMFRYLSPVLGYIRVML
jgi:hypothetical protein